MACPCSRPAIFGLPARRRLTRPASGPEKKKHKERLTYEALRALGEAMRTSGENATAIDAARFILMTGFRRNEALKIQRDWLIPGGVDLPDTKAGPQARAIGRKARELLDRRLRDNNHLWAFPSDTTDRHFVGLPKVLRRLAKLAKIKRVTVHLLRHTFASVAGDLGMSELVIAGLMGHSAGSVTAGYVHLDAALVHAADRVAAAIARALDGKGSAQVIPLQRDRLMHQSQG